VLVTYNIPVNINELKASAVSVDSAFVNSFAKLANNLNMAIGNTDAHTEGVKKNRKKAGLD
jgi:hypothetical protein